MTRYRLLPDVIMTGESAEYEGTLELLHGVPTGRIVLAIGQTGERMVLDPDRLTPVPPPIPPEPDLGVWLIGGEVCQRTQKYHDRRWLVLGESDLHTWAKIWAAVGGPDVPIVRLVPEFSDRAQPPARCARCGETPAGARTNAAVVSDRAQQSTVDLPWSYIDGGGDKVAIGVTREDHPAGAVAYVQVDEEGRRRTAYLDSHEARMGAAAAILAADQAIGGEE